MEKQYDNYLLQIKKIATAEISEVIGLSEDMVRKYKTGRNLPPLDRAVLLNQRYSIPYEFWVTHNIKYKIKSQLKL